MRELSFLVVAALVSGCSSEGSASSGLELEPTASLAPTSLSSAIQLDQPAEDETPPDAGGGLEFDPVSGRLIIPEAGPPAPRAFKPDTKLTTDAMMRAEQLGLTLTASFVPRNLAGPPKAPEVNAPGLEAAAKLTAPRVSVTLTALGRMKIVFESRALPFPFRSEIRARFDRYGSLVFWPGASQYRIIPPGALRPTLDEGRVDVTPLVAGTKGKGGSGTRLGQSTRTVELESPLGKLRLELAAIQDAGLGGPLLCRTFVELIGIDPATNECKPEEVPLLASIDWKQGNGVDFVVSSLEKRQDLPPAEVLVPPPASERTESALPTSSDGIYLSQDELAAFRTRAIENPPADPAAPPDGFIAENGRNQALTLYLDGVPVVQVPALDKRYLIGPLRGRYVAQWRTFLGDRIEEATTVELPGVLRSVPARSGADAGP